MNLIITIPKNWNPKNKNDFNKWFNKISKQVKINKLK